MADKNMTVTAKEISDTRIQIDLPSGSVKVRQIREIGDSPVAKAAVRIFEDGGFQVSHLEYADGTSSQYLGNVFLHKDEDGECY